MALIHTDIIINWFKLKFLPTDRRIYAVTNGRYVGEWLVRIRNGKDSHVFFSLPDKQVRVITKKDWDMAIQNKLVDPVDVLPKGIYNVCLAEWRAAGSPLEDKNTDVQPNHTSNRRKQRPTPSALGDE